MMQLNLNDIYNYIEKNIGEFHKNRYKRLENLRLNTILKKKNPYLFKAKNILTSETLIKSILDAYLSSQEETIFGHFLEGLAIFINEVIYNGTKSCAEGIDLEFNKDNTRYIVTIKSGPNWGNSSQIQRMKDNFKKAMKILRANNPNLSVIPINGCCYGKTKDPNKGDYYKYCGQEFWEFISDNENLYTDIIQPLGYKAKEKNQKFLEEYAKIINKFSFEFSKRFCVNGEINWEKLVVFNSSK